MVGRSVPALSPVFLFIGEDRLSKEKALKDIVSRIPGDPAKGLDYKVFSSADADPAEVLDYISTRPFLAEKRVAVIKEADKIASEFRAALIRYIVNPSKSTCLVLDAPDASILAQYDKVAGNIDIRKFGNMTGRELVSWVEGFLSKLGKSIEPGAAAALTELQGNNLLSMTQELEKLASFSGKRKSITAEDVEELTGRSLAASAFDITRAIDGNKIDDAMKICSDLIRTGRKEHEIVGLLCWHLRRVLKAKMMQARGLGTGQIALAMNVGRRYQDEFFRQVSGLKTARIRSRIMALLDADLDIKRTRLNPRIVLEIAVIRLCLC